MEVQLFPDDTHGLGKPQTSFLQWLRIAAFCRLHTAAKE